MSTEHAIDRAFVSPNVSDDNFEPANVVDVINRLARMTYIVAKAITPDAAPGHDATGGQVQSLTEAAMGITAGLVQVAGAIDNLAEAVRERQDA